MTAIAVVVVSVGGRGAAATSVMSEVTAVMTFEVTSDAIVVAKATAVLAAEASADATVLAWRATAARTAVARATSDAMAAGKASAAAKTPRTRQRRTGTATPLAFRSRPAGRKSSRY